MTEIEVPSRQQDRWQQIDRMKSKSACTICDYLVPTSSTSRENKYFGTITCPHQKKRENHLNIDVHSAGCSIVNTPNPLEKQGQRFDFHLPTPQSPRFLNLPTPPRSRLSSPSHFTEHKKFGFPPISDDSQSLPEIEVRQIDREELHLPQICNLSIGESHQNLRGVHLRGNRRHSLAPLQQNVNFNVMASMYGKDAQYMRGEGGGGMGGGGGLSPTPKYLDHPPVYNGNPKTIITRTVNVVEEDDEVECTPFMCTHYMGALRWFQLLCFFILQWLIQITCGNDACTMIMNVFGYIALGQVFVLIILLWMSILCVIILSLYGLNGHRCIPGVMNGLEKLYAFSGIVLFPIAGILGAWMAGLTVHESYNYQGRGYAHIRPQWIAAAVIEFLMVPLYVFDLICQRRENFPWTGKEYKEVTGTQVTTTQNYKPTGQSSYYNDYL
ncbi:unnamed protein product, partial [Mesorhabditis belari]|uniref:Uncharacterized protein n=1 Tax=Mesorhabditis belari TaxID=2138241 RepID=A0AAF3FLY8_9BILA